MLTCGLCCAPTKKKKPLKSKSRDGEGDGAGDGVGEGGGEGGGTGEADLESGEGGSNDTQDSSSADEFAPLNTGGDIELSTKGANIGL
mmetsp:Transcript_85965/g.242840  ORF Transcript_85965/g.242840 Transcript_85965/m.242840 type:complete len:88 (+) Transcript_85965:91-354(+)